MTRKLVAGLFILILGLAACRSALREDPILALSVEESLAQGKAQMESGRYGDARKYLLQQMEKHFFGEGADVAQGYVPPPS